MDIKLILAVSSAFLLSACGSTSPNKSTNYESSGNLASLKPASCVSISGLSNMQNPVDIFTGLNSCLRQRDFSNGAELYIAGMTYSFFDTKRVSDKTAHQAISVLRMNLFGAQSEETLSQLQDEITKLTSDNTDVCNKLSTLGPPKYMPTYMIQHGMGAFTGQAAKDGLVQNFDTVSSWNDALSTVAKCAKS